ncbi:DUF5359 family protein [Peribacillus tepidiphilus]|uniref:DUF5359 family protein n=1 Tax=Peribacillus tepidiphilus TaxID=2652445 RepID=UPI00129134F2|nr:DUF5359 family protein [Peribacillus tepidiphilus]
MKAVERILMKLIVIQLLFLLFFQILFHQEDTFLELKKMAQYEGVYSDNYRIIVETMNQLLR